MTRKTIRLMLEPDPFKDQNACDSKNKEGDIALIITEKEMAQIVDALAPQRQVEELTTDKNAAELLNINSIMTWEKDDKWTLDYMSY